MSRKLEIENGELVIRIPLPHPQVLPFFPGYHPDSIAPGVSIKYSDPSNQVGHQQRGWLNYHAVQSFIESGGGIGLDLGSGGVQHPGCLSVDVIGNQESSFYGGEMQGVHVKADASNLWMFGSNMFSCILANHLVEHLNCSRVSRGVDQRERLRIGCHGYEITDILLNHWIRVVRPGGRIAMIIPDDKYAKEVGSSSLFYDETHAHALDSTTFADDILSPLLEWIDIEEYDTFDNHFSFNILLRKK